VKISANKEIISVRLRSARTRAGLSQPQLAELMGVSKGAVGNWESGQNPPSRDKLSVIAEILKTSVQYLAGDTDAIKGPALNDRTVPEALSPTPSAYSFMEQDTLYKNFKDLAARLPQIAKHERKYLIGNLRDMLDEIEQRDLVSYAPLSEAQQILKSLGDRYDQENGKS